MKNSSDKGKWGEEIAVDSLIKKGYEILQRNYKTKFGEIDIICRIKNIVVFTEVKTRKYGNYQDALESVSFHKISRIKKTALLFLQEQGEEFIVRFDVIIVIGDVNSYYIQHLEGAFD